MLKPFEIELLQQDLKAALARLQAARKLIEPDLQTLLAHSPEWAKPLVAAAVRVARVAKQKGDRRVVKKSKR